MSDGASERPPEGKPFVEAARDDRETRLPYGEGGFPWWVATTWLVFLLAGVAYLMLLFFPDVARWGSP